MQDMTKPVSGGASGASKNWMIVALILAVLGIAVSAYSTMHHMEVKASGQTDAACNINEKFNCDEVALSQYSEIAGVPLGVIGLGYFAGLLVLLGIGYMGGKSSKDHIHAYVALVAIGVLVSVVLGGISAGVLGTYCLTCMAIYAICILQAGVLLVNKSKLPSGFDMKGMASGGVNAAIAVAAVIAIFNFAKPTPRPATAANPKDMPTLAAKSEDIPIAKSAYAGLGEDYRKGSDDAVVVIQEFADFQCPACQRISSTLDALHREYGDRIQIVFRNYPLDPTCNSSVQSRIHEFACSAAVLARCAGQYGKFWEFHNLVFGNQREMSDAKLKEWALAVGLTNEQIDACTASQDIVAKIKDDVALGNRLDVTSTPTLFINGKKVLGGRGVAELKTEIDDLLN